LFSLYYRSSGSTAAEGAGIGLYVSRNIVEAMGGTITARSWREGGAEFAFTLAPYVDLEDLAHDEIGGWSRRRGGRRRIGCSGVLTEPSPSLARGRRMNLAVRCDPAREDAR